MALLLPRDWLHSLPHVGHLFGGCLLPMVPCAGLRFGRSLKPGSILPCSSRGHCSGVMM